MSWCSALHDAAASLGAGVSSRRRDALRVRSKRRSDVSGAGVRARPDTHEAARRPPDQRPACRRTGHRGGRCADLPSLDGPHPRRPASRQHRRHAEGSREAARRGARTVHRRRRDACNGLGAPGPLSNEASPVVRYLAPEQALGEGGDRRTRPVCARPGPLRDADGPACLRSRRGRRDADGDRSRAAPVPSARQPSVPAELDAIVARALAKPVDQRYQTASTFAHDLRAVKSALELASKRRLPWPDKAEGRTKLWWWVGGAVVLGAALTAWALWN